MDIDIRLVEKAYGFEVKSLEKIRNIYKADTSDGIKCIKRVHMSPSYFTFIYSAVAHLLENGFDGVIPYNRTLDGRICVPDDKYIYYVVNWIDARECRFKSEEELKKVIAAAAGFHKAATGYKPPEEAKPRVYYGKWIEKFERKCIELLQFSKIIEEKEEITEFDEVFAKYLGFYWSQGKRSIEMLKNSAYKELSGQSQEKGEFCHHDMANHNFLINPEGNIYLIDFDYCIMDSRLHDISSLMIRNMRHGIWDIGKAAFILEEYSRYNPISSRELAVIKAFTAFPQDFWQIGLQFYVEKQPWTMEYFLIRLNKFINDKAMREKFLEEFIRL